MSGNDWRWYCMNCNRDLGAVVGKHASKCPTCGCKSAYATKCGASGQPAQMSLWEFSQALTAR